VVSLVIVAGSALLLASAAIHLHLWADGYRYKATIGPLFFAQGVAGVLLSLAIALVRRVSVAVLGALFAAGTIAALLVSVHTGLFGYRSSINAPWAMTTVVIEATAAVVRELISDAGDPFSRNGHREVPSAVATYAFGGHEHSGAPLGRHHPVEFIPVLVSATCGDKDTPEQPRKLRSAEVLRPVLRPHQLDRALDRDPVGSVAEHSHRSSATAQMVKLARCRSDDKADAGIPRDRRVEDASLDYRCVDRPVGPSRCDYGEGVLFGKAPDVI
jgi:hypothetical protein